MSKKNGTAAFHYVICRQDKPRAERVGHMADKTAPGWEGEILRTYVRDNGEWHGEYALYVEEPEGLRLAAFHYANDPTMFPWCVYWTPGESTRAHYSYSPYARFLTKEDALANVAVEGFLGKYPLFTLVESTAPQLKALEILEKAHPLTTGL